MLNTKKPRKPATCPQKAGRALDAWLRRAIRANFKRNGYQAKQDRMFPAEAYGRAVEVNDTLTADGFDSSYASNAEYSAYQVAQYCLEYCRLNHLTA